MLAAYKRYGELLAWLADRGVVLCPLTVWLERRRAAFRAAMTPAEREEADRA